MRIQTVDLRRAGIGRAAAAGGSPVEHDAGAVAIASGIELANSDFLADPGGRNRIRRRADGQKVQDQILHPGDYIAGNIVELCVQGEVGEFYCTGR